MLPRSRSEWRGAWLSACRPDEAKDPARIAAVVATLARERGVDDWYPRFATTMIEGPAGRLAVDAVAPSRSQSPRAVVLFMPGTNAYTLLYGEFLCALADAGLAVYAFDPRGHGRSDGRRGSYTIPELTADFSAVAAWVRARHDLPVYFAGSSQGGIVALYAAAADPSCAGAVCHNIADLSRPDAIELTRFGRWPGVSLWQGLLRAATRLLARLLPELPVPMPVYLDLSLEPVRGKRDALQVLWEDPLVPWFVRAKTMVSLGESPPPRPLDAFTRPLLVLQATADTIFRSDYIRRLAAQIPVAKVVEFPGTSHYMIVDQAPAAAQVVGAWVAARGDAVALSAAVR